jgi:hypothetical protein
MVGIVVVEQHVALRGLSFALAERAPLPDDGLRREQPDRPVDRPVPPGDLGDGLLGKSRRRPLCLAGPPSTGDFSHDDYEQRPLDQRHAAVSRIR